MEDNIHGCFTPRFVARWWGWACLVRLDTPPQNMPFWWSKIYKSIEIPHQLAPLRLVVSERRGKSGFWKSGWWEAMVQAVDEFLEPILILWKAIPAGFITHSHSPLQPAHAPKMVAMNLLLHVMSTFWSLQFMYSFLGVSLVAHVPIFTIVVPVLHFGWHVLPISYTYYTYLYIFFSAQPFSNIFVHDCQ